MGGFPTTRDAQSAQHPIVSSWTSTSVTSGRQLADMPVPAAAVARPIFNLPDPTALAREREVARKDSGPMDIMEPDLENVTRRLSKAYDDTRVVSFARKDSRTE